MTTLTSRSPYSGDIWAEVAGHTPREVETALQRARAAAMAWARTDHDTRAALLRRVADGLRGQRAAFADLMTREMGKPILQAEAEVDKCAWVAEHYAQFGAAYLTPEPADVPEAHAAFVRFDPLGVVLAVMPWNFPFWQVLRCATPALAAGNAVVLKHASNVPQCALALQRLFDDAGAPPGLFTTLLIGAAEAQTLVAHEAIAAVSLTGSEAAGRALAAAAGAALKPMVLELGGSDPFVVLADADLERAAATAVTARTINNGQSCIAAKRFIVEESVADAFVARLCAGLTALVVGDPRDRATQVGPLARPDLVDDLHDLVTRSVAAGATCVLGGARGEGPGDFYPPTLLDHVRPGMPAFDEETFGPVAAVVRARDVVDAVALANASRFGLGAALWTVDRARGTRLAAEFANGCVFVNGMVKSDPRVPFGGVKASGFGRELGRDGIRAFVNVKTVWVE